MSIKVTIPIAPESAMMPNQLSKQAHWRKRAKVRKECREIARYAAMSSGHHIEPFAGPVELTIHAAYGHKRVTPDLDATIAACKPFFDGLVDAGILADDSQVQKITATHQKLRGKRGEKPQGFTRIEIGLMR